MSKNSCFLCCGLIIFFISYAVNFLIDFLGVYHNYPLVNNNKCALKTGIIGAEDIVNYKGFPLISSDDRVKLLFQPDIYGVSNTPSGAIYTLNLSNAAENVIFQRVPMEGFPSDILFHPHGMSIYNDKLFVLNHAFNKGGERIEVFDILMNNTNKTNNLVLRYNNSIIFGEDFLMMFNDLTVISDNKIFITCSSNVASSPKGINIKETYWLDIQRFLRTLLFQETYVYYLEVDLLQSPDKSLISMIKQIQTADHFNNGISYDGKNLIAVANSMDKRISLYQLYNNELNFIRVIPMNYLVDNIDYDVDSNSFYVGVFGRSLDFLLQENMMKTQGKVISNKNIKSGAIQIKILDDIDKMEGKVMFYQNDLVGVSVACKFNNFVLMGTPFADGVSLCKL